MKRICVIGGGKWGQNHIRTLFEMGNLGGIVESNPKRLKELLEKYPVKGFQDVEAAVKENFDGFTIAAPAPLTMRLLNLSLSLFFFFFFFLTQKPQKRIGGEADDPLFRNISRIG